MLPPLLPLLCRHDFYWSERHLADRCRRCAKLRPDETVFEPIEPREAFADAVALGSDRPFNIEERRPRRPPAPPSPARPSAKVLKAQARERREMLLTLLDGLAGGGRPNREEVIDVVLAVIEDAHASEPVLFGPHAAGHFARLHSARNDTRLAEIW
jgi:hypothetical protein